jgi:ABC-2 type transport system permease protein
VEDQPRRAARTPIDAALARIAVTERARALGLTPAQVAGLFAAAAPTVTLLHATPDRGAQTVIALAGMILLFAALTFYGSFVLTGVVEEKSSRVVEVLLARVRPADLLAGKVLGIGLLGIGQFVALAAVAAVALQIVRPANLPSGVTPLIAIVVLWFVLGYSFYSVLYGALGALATRSEEAQAAAAPLTVVLVLIYFGAFTAIGRPTAWWVTVCSLFPPTAPIFMPLRAGLTDVPAWQMVLAVVIMLVAIAGMIQVGGRLYQGAVLHTAGRLRIRQAWHHTTGSVSSTN